MFSHYYYYYYYFYFSCIKLY